MWLFLLVLFLLLLLVAWYYCGGVWNWVVWLFWAVIAILVIIMFIAFLIAGAFLYSQREFIKQMMSE